MYDPKELLGVMYADVAANMPPFDYEQHYIQMRCIDEIRGFMRAGKWQSYGVPFSWHIEHIGNEIYFTMFNTGYTCGICKLSNYYLLFIINELLKL